MAEISIGAAVGEGFALIRKRPLSILAWGALPLLVIAASFAVFAPFMMSFFSGALHGAASPGSPPNPLMIQNMMRMQSLSYLVDLVGAAINAVVYCAVFRAVLHPEAGRFAFLRVGAPEVMLFLLIVGGYLAFLIALVLAMIPVGIVVAILIAAHAGPVAAIVGVIAGIAALAAVIYVLLRISLVGPMMVDDGKFHLTEAWALTRGKVGGLFALGLLVLLILIAAEIVVGLVFAALGFGVLGSLAGGLNNLPVFFQQPPNLILSKLTPLLVVLALIWIPVMGCLLAITAAPWARAYRDLRPAGDISETFA
jgi:hypothetical protein